MNSRDRVGREMHCERVGGDEHSMAREEDSEHRVPEQSGRQQQRRREAIDRGGGRRESAEQLALGEPQLPQRERRLRLRRRLRRQRVAAARGHVVRGHLHLQSYRECHENFIARHNWLWQLQELKN